MPGPRQPRPSLPLPSTLTSIADVRQSAEALSEAELRGGWGQVQIDLSNLSYVALAAGFDTEWTSGMEVDGINTKLPLVLEIERPRTGHRWRLTETPLRVFDVPDGRSFRFALTAELLGEVGAEVLGVIELGPDGKAGRWAGDEVGYEEWWGRLLAELRLDETVARSE